MFRLVSRRAGHWPIPVLSISMVIYECDFVLGLRIVFVVVGTVVATDADLVLSCAQCS